MHASIDYTDLVTHLSVDWMPIFSAAAVIAGVAIARFLFSK